MRLVDAAMFVLGAVMIAIVLSSFAGCAVMLGACERTTTTQCKEGGASIVIVPPGP
jgi:hypothetical protein